ncbi:uncharacterized protein [Nicotiana sylvestris]|uniref:uncharacterized protein n=1 Tax=Nicotiana sylvestris TaxID=4096 RepID=UPI00388C8105
MAIILKKLFESLHSPRSAYYPSYKRKGGPNFHKTKHGQSHCLGGNNSHTNKPGVNKGQSLNPPCLQAVIKKEIKCWYLGHISNERIERLVKENILHVLDPKDFEICVDRVKEKSEALDKFKIYKTKVEKQLGKSIKIARSDRGSEYYGKYDEFGQCTPEQNGVAERQNCTLMKMEENQGNNDADPIVPEQNIHNEALRRSQRERRSAISDDFMVYVAENLSDTGELIDPLLYSQAISSPYVDKWREAMEDEMRFMKHNSVWELVEFPDAFRVAMALVAHFDLELCKMDVIISFLNGSLLEEVYMVQTEGFKEGVKENLVCKLNKSVYGLMNVPGVAHVVKGDKLSKDQYPKNDVEKITMRDVPLQAVAGCHDTMKSNSRYNFMLAGGVVSWKSEKQSITATSTMKAEFIACLKTASHVVWMKNFLTKL